MDDTDCDVTTVKAILDEESIAEYSLSDSEDGPFMPAYPPLSSDPISGNGDSLASSSSSDNNYPIHYGCSEEDLVSLDDVEVAGTSPRDKSLELEGGIGRLSRNVMVKPHARD